MRLWIVFALAIACSETEPIERRFDDFDAVRPGKASVIGIVQPGTLVTTPSQVQFVLGRAGKQLRVVASGPRSDMLRDGVTVLARGSITGDRVLAANELKVLICDSDKLLRDPQCPPP